MGRGAVGCVWGWHWDSALVNSLGLKPVNSACYENDALTPVMRDSRQETDRERARVRERAGGASPDTV